MFLNFSPLSSSGWSLLFVSGMDVPHFFKLYLGALVIGAFPRDVWLLSEISTSKQHVWSLLLQRLGRSMHFFTAYKSPTTSMVIPFAAAEPLNCFENSLADSSSIYLVASSISLK